MGSGSGSNALNLPSNYNEIIIDVAIKDDLKKVCTFHISKKQIDDGVNTFYSGFTFNIDNGSYGGCVINAENNAVSVYMVQYGATFIGSSDSKMAVYYR